MTINGEFWELYAMEICGRLRVHEVGRQMTQYRTAENHPSKFPCFRTGLWEEQEKRLRIDCKSQLLCLAYVLFKAKVAAEKICLLDSGRR